MTRRVIGLVPVVLPAVRAGRWAHGSAPGFSRREAPGEQRVEPRAVERGTRTTG